MKNALITIIPVITIAFTLSVFSQRFDENPNPIARVEVVEEEIEIVFIRPPTEEEIQRAREYNLKNP